MLIKEIQPMKIKLCDFGMSRSDDSVLHTIAGSYCTVSIDILKGVN